MKTPFEVAKRRADNAATVFVHARIEDSVNGIGAATPVRYVTGESIRSVLSDVRKASTLLAGRAADDLPAIVEDLAGILPRAPSARAGIEIALIDALGKLHGVPSYQLFGGTPITAETDITIPIIPPKSAGERAVWAAEQGFRLLKIKVGGSDRTEDVDRVTTISQAVPKAGLIIDANQAFRPDEAVDFSHKLLDLGARIVVFEQPVEKFDLGGLAWVTERAGIPVFADESAQTAEDVAVLAASGIVNGVNVKLMKSGFIGALEIADICREAGLGLLLGCMLEPRAGITAALHAACAVGGFDYYDLDADLLIGGDTSGGFIREGSRIHPTAGPGLDCQANL
ncbi:MAG: dipeptide epimerase [Armatimonadetes bacterium]|nr:dipeptide epimerase [Armatimonadota bacterium]